MFESIRRIFGRRAPRGIAMIRARLSSDRRQHGTLEAFFPNGETASGPWPAITTMNVGDYLTDAAGFSASGVLALEPRGDGRSTTLAPPTALRGGDVFRSTPDRSLRVPDPAIAELRLFISLGPPIRLEAIETMPFHRWSEAPDNVGSRARRNWIADFRGGDRGLDDDSDIDLDDVDRADAETADDQASAPQDAAAAAALVAAGYVVGSELEAQVGSQSAGGVGETYTPSGGSYDR